MAARAWIVARLVASVAGLALPSTMTAANYNFVKIADSAQFSSIVDSGVSINNSGTVAFAASPVAGGQGVFTGAGGPITTIIEDSEAFNFFRWASINDSGMVAFSGEFDGLRRTILASNGGPVTTIAETINAPNGVPRQVGFPVINSQGVVAFRVFYHELDPLQLNFAIYAGRGGPLTLIANSSGPLHVTNSTPLHMNDSGTVAFAAVLDGSGVGIFTGNGGSLTTIVTSAAGFAGFSDPSINASGTVAFSTQRTSGVQGIFTSSGGLVTTVADSGGPFTTTFGREALINAGGQVAFRATLDAGGSGIFTGPDSVADKVIKTGDPLFGSIITVVGHASASTDGTFDINDNGEIAFRYELANGTFGIAVANPVPEPSKGILLAVGVLGVCLVTQLGRWRRPLTAGSWMATRLDVAKLQALVAVGAGLALPSTTMAANYNFTNIADTTGMFSGFGSPPAINNHGLAAFTALLDAGGRGAYAGSGGPITTIADISGPFSDIGSSPSINDNGAVAFNAELDDGGAGVFIGSGGPIATIADRSGPLNGFSYTAINNNGTVAFNAAGDMSASQSGIFTGNGGPTTPIVNNSGAFSAFGGGGFGRIDINELGTVVFRASLDPNAGGGHGIYSGSGGAVATIADISGVFSSIPHDPSINVAGTVAFSGRLDAGPLGVFTVTNGVVATVVDDSGPFAGFNFIPGINDGGTVVFRAVLDAGGEGLFAGPDPAADKVIQTGEALFGSVLTSIIFDRALNNSGAVAFSYALANGVQGVAVASPVPEPSAILIVVALLAMWSVRCRRQVGSAQ